MVLTFVDSNLDIGQYYKGTSLDYVVYLLFKKSSIDSRLYFSMFFHVYHYSYFRFFYVFFSFSSSFSYLMIYYVNGFVNQLCEP